MLLTRETVRAQFNKQTTFNRPLAKIVSLLDVRFRKLFRGISVAASGALLPGSCQNCEWPVPA
jgi:hypothetical protein